MKPPVRLPNLPNGTPQSNLAGILPLSTLIEFIDSDTKLHSYQLSGRGIAWNWPITPTGARLLLEFCHEGRQKESCVLDQKGGAAPLYCIDMRWGDVFNCINPFTIRTCIESIPCMKNIEDMEADQQYRPQRLEIIHVFLRSDINDPEARKLLSKKSSPEWLIALALGWGLWLGMCIFSMLTTPRLGLAFAYLLMVALTGCWVRTMYGSRARRLIKTEQTKWRRGTIVTDHFNDTNWCLFFGNSNLVDSLLNKPLLRKTQNQPRWMKPSTYTTLMKLIFRLLVAGQWGLIVAASAIQDWDAIIISVFITLCICTSAFIFRTEDSVELWLKTNCVGLEKMTVTFSGRRAMLTALYAISPDDTFRWVDPILATSEDRTRWEKATSKFVREGQEPTGKQFLVDAIHEGTRKASEVNKWLTEREGHYNLPPRDPTQKPFLLTFKPASPITPPPAPAPLPSKIVNVPDSLLSKARPVPESSLSTTSVTPLLQINGATGSAHAIEEKDKTRITSQAGPGK